MTSFMMSGGGRGGGGAYRQQQVPPDGASIELFTHQSAHEPILPVNGERRCSV